MSKLIFLPHMGLGDVFLLNGMIRWLAKRHEVTVMPCKENNLITLRRMFSDVTNLFLLPVAGGLVYSEEKRDVQEAKLLAKLYRQNGYDYVGLGFFGSMFAEFERWIAQGKAYDEFFYLEAGVPYEEKWNSFGTPRDRQAEKALFDRFGVKEGQYIFLHDDPARGRTIDRSALRSDLPVVTPSQMFYKGDILDYGYLLENAAELHVTNSSFADLADFFDLPEGQVRATHYYALIDGHFICPVQYKHSFQPILHK